jgi:hypothetical protein
MRKTRRTKGKKINKTKNRKYKTKGGAPPAAENGATITQYDNLFLDFTKENVSSLEKKMEIFGGNNLLQMIVGMGDYIRPFKGEDMPNTMAYPNYDVYVIYTGYQLTAPELNIQANLDAIVHSDNPNRVICNIDLVNKSQVDLFTHIFNHKMNRITHGDSKVALLPDDSVELLNYDGEGRVDVPLSLLYFQTPGQRGIEYNTLYSLNRKFRAIPDTTGVSFMNK